MGAVQAQDYAGAKWALAQRTNGTTDAAIDQAFNAGAILRTHVLRPTWHFVTPADIRWMLALTAPRVNATLAYNYRRFGLDDDVFRTSNATLARTLQGGKHRTRQELTDALQAAGLRTEALGYLHLLLRAELDAVICSGALRGKQHTYALLDERAPHAGTPTRDEALAELTHRYFTGHGPATAKDYAWWSGLTAADVNTGLALVKSRLAHAEVDGTRYWFSPSAPLAHSGTPTAHLLPNFDEYTVGYTDRSAACRVLHANGLDASPFVILGNVIVLDGQIVGTWKRAPQKRTVSLEARPFLPLPATALQHITIAAERYSAFVTLPLLFQYQPS